jgi:HPt (histidine-containing phosphotransfer) domain-containing protein
MSPDIDTQDVKFDVQTVIDKTGLDLEDYLEIYELFQENFNDLMKDLEGALQAKDSEQVMRIAHTLKGSTSNIGFMTLSELARMVQENPDDYDMVGDKIPEMRSLYEKLNKQVESIAQAAV